MMLYRYALIWISNSFSIYAIQASARKSILYVLKRYGSIFNTRIESGFFVCLFQKVKFKRLKKTTQQRSTRSESLESFHLQINGRNVDNKTVPEAIQVIGLSKDKVTMLIRKEDGGTVSLPASHFAAPSSRDRAESRSEGKRPLPSRFELGVYEFFDCFAAGDNEPSRRSSFSKASEKIE